MSSVVRYLSFQEGHCRLRGDRWAIHVEEMDWNPYLTPNIKIGSGCINKTEVKT